jgi:hemerythrin-like domain-containing protein
MSDPIETLMAEHRLIEGVLASLDAWAVALDAGNADRDDLPRFVRFIREFADAKHHAKEEDILFTVMADHGFPTQAGPIAVMLHEHDAGRAYVKVLAEATEGADWDASERARLTEAARGFVSLLRQHIPKEDNVLYPMAVDRLPPEAMQRVAERCAAVEDEYARSKDGERLEALGRELIARYT